MKQGSKVFHANQKPLRLMERIIEATSDPGDVVWEPFGGLCTGAVAAVRTGRRCFSSEVIPEFYDKAVARLERERSAWRAQALRLLDRNQAPR